MSMYSVHHEGEYIDETVGSLREAYITLNHDFSPEVRGNGEIKKSFRKLQELEDDDDRNLFLCSVEEWQNSTVIRRSIGLCFSESVSYRQPPTAAAGCAEAGYGVVQVEASANLPVRLIDIRATLADSSLKGGVCFTQPTDWSFHIISHTWSLAVRNLSISIGEKVTSAEDYNSAFQNAKLNELPGEAGVCYRNLLAFLRLLLQEEGVRDVWFDALCINQTDKEEKDREIRRMGAYYGRSLGCYVLAHGIGQGFKLWEDGRRFPRWFERVWTLQEFLLPRKVTFVVEGLSKKTIGYVNHFIHRAGVPGFCECALPERDHLFRAELADIDVDPGVDQDEIICSSGADVAAYCGRCRCGEFIRKSHQQPGLYFVDREAYCFLSELDLGPACCPSHLQLQKFGDDNETSFWDLFALANHHCPSQLFKIVKMVRARECTNEEDRVLGMLGLLQSAIRPARGGGNLQLRSGETLTKQLLKLHHYCDLETFFRLCLMEPLAFPTNGMSWAPCLERDEFYYPVELGEWLPAACFHPCAEILHVGPRGLRLKARVAYGRLVPRGKPRQCTPISKQLLSELQLHSHHLHREKFEFYIPHPYWSLHSSRAERDNVGICYSCIVHQRRESCTHWMRDCELEVGQSYTFPLKAHTRKGCCQKHAHKHRYMVIQDPWVGTSYERHSYAEFVMSFPSNSNSIHALKPFPVWIVLFAKAHQSVHGSSSVKETYWRGMVCIAKNDTGSELHKIGTFSCPQRSLSFQGIQYKKCLIGGFGENVDEYVYHLPFRRPRPSRRPRRPHHAK